VLEQHVEELATIESAEIGRPLDVGRMWINGVVAGFRRDLEVASSYPFSRETDATTIINRRPLGVAAVIAPWNFPTNIILGALAPLLAAGNTVVIKPSEKSPLSAARLAELIDLPPGVVNVVFGDGATGAALVAHPGIAIVHFTGSVRAGQAIATASGTHLRRLVLELGGKDPVIVDEGVDVAAVARDVATGAFMNTGQICTSMERIYVHRAVADEFVSELVAEATRYRHGDPSGPGAARIGPMIDEGQRDLVARQVADAVAGGATVHVGGVIPPGPGFYYPATVLSGVTDEMSVMTDETFGPLAPIQIVESFEEALDKAGRTSYGLAATVYTNDPAHIEAARDIPAGIIWINRWQGGGSHVIFEPAGASGLTAMGDIASFDAATRPVAILSNHLAG
jgi:acyl-CoA reductase-like NAD-dependent aldehyde dehydrogenase